MKTTLEERFWEKVDKSGDCWLWTAFAENGYGRFRVGGRKGRHRRAHRVAYELEVGPIPDEADILQDCGARNCVRPDHLYTGGAKNGEGNGRSKLTEGWVLHIKWRYSAGGITQAELAERYGVHPSTISLVVREMRWKYLLESNHKDRNSGSRE